MSSRPRAGARDERGAGRLLELVYDELRRLAERRLAREQGPQTLQPTALVHEAWLRLGGDEQPTWRTGRISSVPLRRPCGAS